MHTQLRERAGLTVIRGGIDRELAHALDVECASLLATPREEIYYYTEFNPAECEETMPINTRGYRVTTLVGAGLAAMSKVMELHPYPEEPDANILINGQGPGAAQVFHPDIVMGGQLVVHASDGGAFDFYLPGSSDFETIYFEAGDLLRLDRPAIRHRGRNPSSHHRHTLVFSSGLPIE